MADGIDTSIYRESADASPFDFQNKLLDFQRNQQQVALGQQSIQANQIKLATDRFGAINNAASGLLSDPDLGTKDVTSKLWDTLGRLTKGDTMTAQHAVQFMQQFPSDPRLQAQAIKNVYSQTLGPWERGKAWLGENTPVPTGGGTKFVQQPAFGNAPPQDRGFIPNTLSPGTSQVNSDLSQSYVGAAGNPAIQGPNTMPVVNGAPARPKVASSNKLMGDDEAVKAGLYPSPSDTPAPAANPRLVHGVLAQPAPGAKAPLEESGNAYAKDLADSRNYSTRMAPLQQAIPLLERTKTGLGQEMFQNIGSIAETLGLPVPNKKQITDYAEAKKYLSQNAAMAAPPGTNIPSVLNSMEANPSVKQPNEAAVNLSKMLYGLGRLRQASVLAFQQAKKKEGLQDNDYTDWASKWSRDQDPRAYMADLMTPEQRKKLSETIKPGTTQATKFRQSFDTAKSLGLLGDVEGHEVR